MVLPDDLFRVEIAPGGNPADPTTWQWEDITSRRRQDPPIVVSRGRRDEGARVAPTSISTTLDNRDGRFSRHNPLSSYYGRLHLGTPLRVLRRGTPSLLLNGEAGARASTPDHASLDITGDIDVRAELTPVEWHRHRVNLVNKWGDVTADRSWDFYLWSDDAGGRLAFIWQEAGGTFHDVGSFHGDGTPAVVPVARGTLAVRATLDVDDGAGAWLVRFYTGPSIDGPWEQLGSDRTATPTTDIRDTTTEVAVGHANLEALEGRAHRAQVRDGIGGTVVADPDFTAQEPGATSFVDSAGRTWSVDGDAEIADLYPRATGFVVEWPPRRDQSGRDRTVAIKAAGPLRRLGQGQGALRSSLRRLVLAPINEARILGYWPMEDGQDTTRAASATPNASSMHVSDSVEFAVDGDHPGSDALANVAGDTPAGWSAVIHDGPTDEWAVDIFWRIPTPASSPGTPLFTVRTTGSIINTWVVRVDSTSMRLQGLALGGLPLVSRDQVIGTDLFPDIYGAWAWARLDLAQDGSDIDYRLSWATVVNPAGTFAGFTDTLAGTDLGRPSAVANLYEAPADGISWGHLVVTTDTEVGWLAPADRGWTGERAHERIDRLCNEERIPHAVHGTASEPMGPQAASPILDLLREAEAVDGGVLYEDEAARLAYLTREGRYNQAPALELTGEHLAAPPEPTDDDAGLVNDVTVKREGGSSARAVDDESVAEEGRYEHEVTVNAESDGRLHHLAHWRKHLGTTRELRWPRLDLKLHDDVELIDPWGDFPLGGRVTVDHEFAELPGTTVDVLVDGSTERMDRTRWAVELTATPARPWDVGVLGDEADLDTGLPRLGAADSTLDAAIGEADTSIDVDHGTGEPWTTDAAHLPVDIEIGGERMAATAIGAPSGTVQTFTVTRAVNGIGKAHGAGAAVQVADPIRLAL
ncbi:MAG: hypothetical protein ACLFXM_16150 [Acidimicrobiia bacterium]